MIKNLDIDEQFWITSELKLILNQYAKNSTFLVDTGDTSAHDIEHYENIIKNGSVKDTDLWIFWLKHEAHIPFDIPELDYVLNLHKVCKKLEMDESKVVFINCDLDLHKNYDKWFEINDRKYNLTKKINCIGFPWYFLQDRENILQEFGKNPYKFIKYQDREELPNKKFICLNGTYNRSRKYIIDKLENFKQDGYLSDLSREIQLDNIPIKELVGDDRSDEPSVFLLEDFHKDS